MVGDVLEADEPGLETLDKSGDVGPEMSLIFVGALLPGHREGTARITASDDIHDATPRLRIEGAEITPDRCLVQRPFFHTPDQYAGCIGFPLQVTDRANAMACPSDSLVQSELETSDAGADGEGLEGSIGIFGT